MSERVTLVADFKDNISGPSKTAGGNVDKFGKTAGIAGTAVIGLGVAVLALAKKMGDLAAEVRDTAADLNMTTDEVQGMNYAFEQTGGSAGTFEKAMKGVTAFMRTAERGGAAQTEVLDKLGITYEELAAMDPAQQFYFLTDAIGSMEDPTAQATTGATLFGGAYQQIIGTLNQADGSIRSMSEAFQESDMLIPAEDIARLGEFADKWTDLEKKFQSLMAEAIMPMLPMIEDMADKFMEVAQDGIPALIGAAEASIPILMGMVNVIELVSNGLGKLTGADARAEIDTLAESLKSYAEALEVEVARGTMTATAATSELKNMMDASIASYGGNVLEAAILRAGLDDLSIGINLTTAAWTEFQNRFKVTDDIITAGEAIATAGQGIFDVFMQDEGIVSLLDAISSFEPPEVPTGTGREEISAKVIAALQAEKDAYHDNVEAEIEEIARRDEAVQDSEEARREARLREKEEQSSSEEAAHQLRLERLAELQAVRQEIFRGFLGLLNEISAAQIQNIRQEQKADTDKAQKAMANEIAAIKASTLGEKEKSAKIAEIKEKYAQKIKSIDEDAQKAFIDNKKKMKVVKVADAISNIALGVTKALSSAPPPWNIGLAAITAAAGAVQISTIAAQKFAHGGIVQGPGGVDSVHAMLTPGEFVLTPQETDDMLRSQSAQPQGNVYGETVTNYYISIPYGPTFSTGSPGELVVFGEAVVDALERVGVPVG